MAIQAPGSADRHPGGKGEVAGTGRFRDRYLDFIERHEVAWELSFAALAIAYVIVGLADETRTGQTTEMILTGVFVAEFASRIGASKDRWGYLRGHWIDLVAVIPTGGFRLARLLRLLRLVRAFAGVYRVMSHMKALAQHRGLAWLFVAWGAVMVICSVGVFAAESGNATSTIKTPFDALWWGIVTLTTVGYGDVQPTTPQGRLFASILMLLGIGLFSAITATVTSYLIETRSHPIAMPADRSLATRLTQLDEAREAGLLTEQEHAARRAKILDEA
jgi:voltage-gated potassium channel